MNLLEQIGSAATTLKTAKSGGWQNLLQQFLPQSPQASPASTTPGQTQSPPADSMGEFFGQGTPTPAATPTAPSVAAPSWQQKVTDLLKSFGIK